MSSNQNNIRRITHVFMERSEPDVWIPLCFITEKDGYYYLGYEHIFLDANYVPDYVKVRRLRELQNPIEVDITGCMTPWLTPEREIYLTCKEDPVINPNRRLIDRVEGEYSTTQDFIDRVLLRKEADSEPAN